jgi:uncharacterized protein (TIGR02118 family)
VHNVLFFVYRKPELSKDEFFRHYRDSHVPIAQRFPKLRKYDIYPIQQSPGADGEPDAFAIMTFESPEDFASAVGSPEFAEAVIDNESFVDHFDTYVVDRLPVIEG